MKIKSFFFWVSISTIYSISCAQQPSLQQPILRASQSCPDVLLKVADESPAINGPSAQPVSGKTRVKKKGKKKCTTDCCWKYTSKMSGCMSVAALLCTAAAVISFRDSIPQLISSCENAQDAVNQAMPDMQQILETYPEAYNAVMQAIEAMTLMQPYIQQIPVIGDLVSKVDADVQTLINDAQNCTQIDSKRIETITLGLAQLKNEFTGMQRVPKTVNVTKLQVPQKIVHKATNLDVQKMPRQKFKLFRR